jgi:hypothetical protein
METIQFLKLFKQANFIFYPVESGCAAFYPIAPFGTDKTLLFRVAQILDMPEPKTKKELMDVANIYVDFMFSFETNIQKVELAIGAYEVSDIDSALKKIFKGTEDDIEKTLKAEAEFRDALNNSFKDYKINISITDTHLAMIKHSVWQIEDECQPIRDEYSEELKELISTSLLEIQNASIAAPANSLFTYPIITGDGKRPYGDFTYYYRELEALGVPGIKADVEKGDEYGPLFSEKEQKRIDKLQGELNLVLQAMAQYGYLSA